MKHNSSGAVSGVELLAPAGSLEAFFAAMDGGADAVYCGLQAFSARAKAKNFSITDLAGMCAYAHQQRRKLFVTVNTLVREDELPQLIDALAAVSEAGADAVIVQDLAVWRLAREHFPQLSLHASTQMTIHNSAGARQLEQMGFERVVLARELTLDEISNIRRNCNIELEHFVHGALCFCFSGQCYFSSWLGGKSGNRGRCTQPCRRRYNYRGRHGYYFSPNDLSALELLPTLARAGVSCFKIEGRMKSAEYVHQVVKAYRLVLDGGGDDSAARIKQARAMLKDSFGRAPTQGFLAGGQPADMATPGMRGATGRYLGEVRRNSNGRLYFNSRDPLHIGDRIRIQPGSDKVGTAFTIKQLWVGKRAVKKTAAGLVGVSHSFGSRFKAKDAVFKVASQQAFSISDNACRRRLQQVKTATCPLRLNVRLDDTVLELCGRAAEVALQRRYQVEVYPATNNPLSQQTLTQVFAATGRAPFELELLNVDDLPAVVIPPKRLKEIRRDFYAELEQMVHAATTQTLAEQKQRAQQALLPAGDPRPQLQEVTVAVRDIREMRALDNHNVDRILVPVTAAVLHRRWRATTRQRGGVVWDLPWVCFDQEWGIIEQAVQCLLDAGFRRFRLNNLSHFRLFADSADVELYTGYRLFCLNSQAMLAWQELGASGSELYIEDGRENMANLLRRSGSYPLQAVIYALVPLLTSRIDINSLRGGDDVVSDRGERYRVSRRAGLSVLQSHTPLSLTEHIGELHSMGCGGYLVDLSHCGVFSNEGRQVLDAVRLQRQIPGSSNFNFDRGIE